MRLSITAPANLMLTCIMSLLTALAAGGAAAQDAETQEAYTQPRDGAPGRIMLGLGIAMSDEPYAGYGTKVVPIPMFAYLQEGLEAGLGFARYTLLSDGPFSLSAIARLQTMGYDSDDSNALEGMSARDWTLELGLATAIEGPWGSLALSATTDVLGEHDGQEVRLAYSVPLGGPYFQIEPAVGVTWFSENLADHYFGVRPNEARAERPAYAVDSAVNLFAEVRVLMPLSRRWALVVRSGIEWLDDEITDSPIVEDDYRFGVFVGASYMF